MQEKLQLIDLLSCVTGNEAPQVSVDALYSVENTPPKTDDARVSDTAILSVDHHSLLIQQWEQILPVVDLGPSSRHLFKIPQTSGVNYIKLNMYPDGGIVSRDVCHHYHDFY